jgi:hypothetical protein
VSNPRTRTQFSKPNGPARWIAWPSGAGTVTTVKHRSHWSRMTITTTHEILVQPLMCGHQMRADFFAQRTHTVDGSVWCDECEKESRDAIDAAHNHRVALRRAGVRP